LPQKKKIAEPDQMYRNLLKIGLRAVYAACIHQYNKSPFQLLLSEVARISWKNNNQYRLKRFFTLDQTAGDPFHEMFYTLHRR
jgi:hypothetical protein